MVTFSLKLSKWSFHVADLLRTRTKCTEIKQGREGRAKLLFLLIKYAHFVVSPLSSRRRSILKDLSSPVKSLRSGNIESKSAKFVLPSDSIVTLTHSDRQHCRLRLRRGKLQKQSFCCIQFVIMAYTTRNFYVVL